MKTEKRLIDANALLNTVLNHFGIDLGYYGEDLQFCQEAIENAPTVDAVEVVRCKDCKYCSLDLRGRENNLCMQNKVGFLVKRKLEDFCSYGERREGK